MKLQSVLVIDDSDADLLYADIVLRRADIAEQVTCLGTAQEGLTLLGTTQGHPIELVLLDLNMPEMDGFAFLDAFGPLRARGAARAHVVVLTSSPHPDDRRRALAHNCVVGYLVKPLDLAQARGLPALALGSLQR